MHVADATLARRLEMNKLVRSEAYARAQEQLRPGSTALLPVAGGLAVFVGAASPISKVMGLGMQGPVTEVDLERIEAFYRRCGATVQVELCPLADESLIDLFGRRGYRTQHFRDLHIRSLTPGAPLPGAHEGIQIAHAEAKDADLWMRTIACGFAGRNEISEAELLVPEPMARIPTMTCYLARLGGQIAGGAALTTYDGLGFLSTSSTLPAFRCRGVQTALLHRRLLDAAAAGCDLAASETAPGNASQRNLERMGFRIAYTVLTMVREPMEPDT